MNLGDGLTKEYRADSLHIRFLETPELSQFYSQYFTSIVVRLIRSNYMPKNINLVPDTYTFLPSKFFNHSKNVSFYDSK